MKHHGSTEEKAMLTNIWNQKKRWMGGFGFAILTVVMVLAGFGQGVFAADAGQKSFKSPEEAVKTLIDATKGNDTKELMAIFGPAGKELISSGDEVADQFRRDRFIKAYEAMNRLVSEVEKKVVLHVGNRDWPFPIPMVKDRENWFFNTKAGKQEVLNRRIGRNELNTIQVSLAYVDTQREYALKSRGKGGFVAD